MGVDGIDDTIVCGIAECAHESRCRRSNLHWSDVESLSVDRYRLSTEGSEGLYTASKPPPSWQSGLVSHGHPVTRSDRVCMVR